jgi:acyl-CoA thioester hydrolase
MRQHGMSYAEMEKGGMGLTVSEFSVRLHASARYDDLVRIATTLTSVRSRQVTFEYLLTNAVSGERLATARTSLVSISPGGRPTAMPASVRARLAQRGAAEQLRLEAGPKGGRRGQGQCGGEGENRHL